MSVVDGINAFEVVWWIGCGIVVGVKSLQADPPHHGRGLLSAVTLVLFGLSDVVELQTGAWWRPWWLAVWKGLCINILIACAIIHFRTRVVRTIAPITPIEPGMSNEPGDETREA